MTNVELIMCTSSLELEKLEKQFHEISVEVTVNLCVCKCLISQIALVSPTLILNVKMLKHGRTHALVLV